MPSVIANKSQHSDKMLSFDDSLSDKHDLIFDDKTKSSTSIVAQRPAKIHAKTRKLPLTKLEKQHGRSMKLAKKSATQTDQSVKSFRSTKMSDNKNSKNSLNSHNEYNEMSADENDSIIESLTNII
jgi:hypothetical protein